MKARKADKRLAKRIADWMAMRAEGTIGTTVKLCRMESGKVTAFTKPGSRKR
jgi:hypothetical protein